MFQSCLPTLLQVAATIKHEGFSEEREWRFISPMINTGDERIHHRTGRSGRPIPYVHFSLAGDSEDLVVHEIMVGPGKTQDEIHARIVDLVRANRVGLTGAISTCEIPYRDPEDV